MSDVWDYLTGLGLMPSDFVLMGIVLPVTYFVIVYGFFTKWWADPFGWIILGGALSLGAFLIIVIYAVFAGERINEPVRFVLLLGVLLSWIGKDVILHETRREGRLARRQSRLDRAFERRRKPHPDPASEYEREGHNDQPE